MTTWTPDTTEGFTAAELSILAKAQERLEQAFPRVDAKNIADYLNNDFYPGITENELILSVSKRLDARE